jgi:prevent-host-death family protein
MRRSESWSVQEAKNRFSEVVQAAQKRPQLVTKHGKAAVVVLSAQQYERLRQCMKAEAPSFVDLLLAMPRGGEDFERLPLRPRDVEF